MLSIKRAYDPPSVDDGQRVLVDRLWPRGISKEKLALTAWIKGISPSDELRRWYHAGGDWDEFIRRYDAELSAATDCVTQLRALMAKGKVTLLHASRAVDRNNATVLRDWLTTHDKGG